MLPECNYAPQVDNMRKSYLAHSVCTDAKFGMQCCRA